MSRTCWSFGVPMPCRSRCIERAWAGQVSSSMAGIASQLRRSSKSVCALLVEGVGRLRRSRVEFERYLVMALGSADETRLWCRYAEDLGYATAEQGAAWRDSYEEIARMLQGLLARQKRQLSPDH